MLKLTELTERQFYTLKDTNLLYHFYPEAPNEFNEIIKRPTPLGDPNFSTLVGLCEYYLDSKEDPENNRFKDGIHYIFEEAIECVYGKDSGVWDYINSFDN